MASSPEHDPKQASQALPPIEEIKNWVSGKLLEWIKDNRPNLLNSAQVGILEEQDISGDVFLNHAGDAEFFENKCKLTPGPSERLANLAMELARGETAGVRSKLQSSMPCTQCRQQANNVTGNIQQARYVEMSDTAFENVVRIIADLLGRTAGIKSKFTIFIYAHYVDCKLTTSQEYSRRRSSTSSSKSYVDCRTSPQVLVSKGNVSGKNLKSSTSHPYRLPKTAFRPLIPTSSKSSTSYLYRLPKTAFSAPIPSSSFPILPSKLICRPLSSVS
jgi:hypothetical protein